METEILIVEQNEPTRQSLAFNLLDAGYTPIHANSGEHALELLRVHSPALVLLEIDLPDMDGFEVLRALRHQVGDLPIMFVTARQRTLDEIVGLDLGADDYVRKPYDIDVLLVRIKALLRRVRRAVDAKQQAFTPSIIEVGGLHIDLSAHTVHLNGSIIELRHRVYDLLVALARSAGQVVTEEALITRVWGPEWIGETQTLYVHIHDLRAKIEDNAAHPKRLLTVRSAGYKLVP